MKPVSLPPARVLESEDTRTATCPECGGPMTPISSRCLTCANRADWDRHERLVALWNAGVSQREIAKQLGTSEGMVEFMVDKLRQRGERVPYRLPRRRR